MARGKSHQGAPLFHMVLCFVLLCLGLLFC